MKKTLEYIFLALFLLTFCFPALAQETVGLPESTATGTISNDTGPSTDTIQDIDPEEAFEARVLSVLEERKAPEHPDASVQQKLRLIGLDGTYKGKEFEYNGLTETEIFGANTYKPGDRVLVQRAVDPDGTEIFYVVDYVRRVPMYVLALLFIIAVIVIAQNKGLRALIGLGASFFVIMGAMVPLIVNGWPPLPVGIIGAVIIFLLLVYITEGWNTKSHLALMSIAASLLMVGILAGFFTWLTKLTGTAQEETMFLIGLTKQAINFKGLLLTGMIIGALGVLDDVVIGQIESVAQLKNANPSLPWTRVFKMALEVGNAHMGSMVNTLFLAYAGASLPLLLLFNVKQPPFMNFWQAINNEIIATEIVRTLVGSLGIALAMPIATYLAARFYKPAFPVVPDREPKKDR